MAATKLPEKADFQMTTMVGTPGYIPPEIWRRLVHDAGSAFHPSEPTFRYSTAVDSFAYAGLIWTVIMRKRLYRGVKSAAIKTQVEGGRREKITSTPASAGVDDRLTILMNQCWDHEPARRPNFITIIGAIADIEPSISTEYHQGVWLPNEDRLHGGKDSCYFTKYVTIPPLFNTVGQQIHRAAHQVTSAIKEAVPNQVTNFIPNIPKVDVATPVMPNPSVSRHGDDYKQQGVGDSRKISYMWES